MNMRWMPSNWQDISTTGNIYWCVYAVLDQEEMDWNMFIFFSTNV